MKKGILILILAVVIAGGVFAQADAVNNWISGELSLLGVGARYEYMLTPNFSVGAYAYWNNLFIIWNDWGVGAVGRFYPWGKTFYAELGLGFGYHSGVQDISYTTDWGDKYTDSRWVGITGFSIIPGLGWKIDLGEPGGFFIQPGIKLPLTLGKKKLVDFFSLGDYASEFGVGVGIIAYCGFGFAF